MDDLKITNTAFLEWDIKWQTDEGRNAWNVPSPEVIEILGLLKKKDIKSVLDLGCGIGRHSLLLAKSGFTVHAMDGSEAGIEHLKEKALEEKLKIDAICNEMTNLPYEDSSFDYVLAWNVIYHGNLVVVKRVLSEVMRILKPGGIFQVTMLSKRNSEYKKGTRISLNTYVNTEDKSDKNHPHFYCNATELILMLFGFEPISIYDKEQVRPGSFHWHIVAEKI